MKGLFSSLLIVALAVVVFWLLGNAVGFEMSLVSSLLISVALTLVLNLVLGGFRRRRTY